MPRPSIYGDRVVTIEVEMNGTEKSLPLEGKVVRLKPDRMRSKVTALYQPMVMIGSFDLISRN